MTKFPTILLSSDPAASSPFAAVPAGSDDGALRDRYARLAIAYERGLSALGAPVTRLDAPSIYHTAEARATIGVRAPAVHIAARPVAHVRPFHGVANYALFDGPVGLMNDEVPFSLRSEAEIFGALDGVLCTSPELVDELRARGIANGRFLPPSPMAAPTKAERERVLGAMNARQADGEARSVKSICDAVRSRSGQLILWDGAEGVDYGLGLEALLHAARTSGRGDARCILVMAGGAAPFSFRQDAPSGSSADSTCWVDRAAGDEQRRALLHECGIFVRTTPASGLDLDVVTAVAGGALALVPHGHSAMALAESGAVFAYCPETSLSDRGSPKERPALDLGRALDVAIGAPVAEREARGRKAAGWVTSRYGLSAFGQGMLAL